MTLERRVEVVHFERHVRKSLDCRVEWAVRRIPHPFNAEWAGGETGNVKPERSQVRFVWPRLFGGNANMMITPPELRDDWRRLVIAPVD